MDIKELNLFDSEIKVLNLLWDKGTLSASEISKILGEEIGWKRNTTYTVIQKCINKGAVSRKDPGFICTPIISREEVQQKGTDELIEKMFDSSDEKFLAAFISSRKLSAKEMKRLKDLIDNN